MATHVSEEETNQILRTVEMFEAITESQPDDSQSLEILKEAYNKLGRQADSLRISKKLAGAYVRLGQISHAILEYEGILKASVSTSARSSRQCGVTSSRWRNTASSTLSEGSGLPRRINLQASGIAASPTT